MMLPNGVKLMECIVMAYDIFSLYNMDISNEQERLEVVSKKVFGQYREKEFISTQFQVAKQKFIELNYDVEAEQIKNVEFTIGRMIKERDTCSQKETLSLEDLEKVETITKTLKNLFTEREELIEHFVNRIKLGKVTGKVMGGKKLGFLADMNNKQQQN